MQGILMTKKDESFFEGTRHLVIAIASGGSSDIELGPELRSQRTGFWVPRPGFPLHFAMSFSG